MKTVVTEQLLKTLTEALREAYSDPIAPGVTVAYIKDGDYYASAVRWPSYDTKEIVTYARAKSPNEAVAALAKIWLRVRKPTNARSRLEALVHE